MMNHTVSYSLVLSDLHFGDTRCSLHSMKVARELTSRLRDFLPLRQIILLGDILDLQLANWAQAVEGMILPGGKRTVGFRYFLNFLISETNPKSIIYVPGNHDYRIFDFHSIERSVIDTLRSGRKLSGRVAFFRTFDNSFLSGLIPNSELEFKVVYPHYILRWNSQRFVLTHGHFFDPTQAFNHEVGKIFSSAGFLPRKQIAKIRHNYFRRASLYQNLVSGLSIKREMREWFCSLYHPLTALKKRMTHRSRKTFLTPAMRRSIEHYITYCCRPGKVAGVIFGHTHSPGKASIARGPVHFVWNSGTFLQETKSSSAGSFITIRHDRKCTIDEAVRVHTL